MNHLMQIFALFMLLGFFLSWLIPETKGKTLEELCGENDEDELRRQAEANHKKRGAKLAQPVDSPALLPEIS